MSLQTGTYVRAPDETGLIFHSPQTCWNFPREGLRGFLANRSLYQEGSLWYWRQLEEEEGQALQDSLGAILKPGEYTVVE